MQVGYGFSSVLTKAAMSEGVNQFAVYRDVIALCLLGPLAYFSERELHTSLTLPTLLMILALGFTGVFLQQTLFLAGLTYTNTAFAAAMQNAIPVFTFMIAAICKLEVIRISKTDGMAKIVGMFAAVAGALTMCLYKGPTLLGTDPEVAAREQQSSHDALNPPEADGWFISTLLGFGVDYWQIGALCLISAPVSLATSSIFVGALALVITGLTSISQASEWILRSPGTLISVFYAGSIASGLSFSLQAWANQRGGPVLVAAYIPLQTVFSAFLGVVILDDPLHLGSVIGAVFILAGLYLVIWGQRLHRLCKERECMATPFSGVADEIREPLLTETVSGETTTYGAIATS
ncbi:hypothetical protein Mapa_012378 [Marchantia paleacea]|nr:hypothetical protein Mapa_012378 [Marchantia paleacea]